MARLRVLKGRGASDNVAFRADGEQDEVQGREPTTDGDLRRGTSGHEVNDLSLALDAAANDGSLRSSCFVSANDVR